MLVDGCPACGCRRFAFISSKRRSLLHPENEEIKTARQEDAKNESEEIDMQSLESIRIREPGCYDLNLIKLASTDDRVVKVGKEDTYRLDLHSMIRKKKQ